MELPSGTLDLNESLIEALAREVTEETDLKITKIDSYLGFLIISQALAKKRVSFLLKFWLKKGEGALSLEHQAFYEIDIHSNDFLTLNISSETRVLILKAFEE